MKISDFQKNLLSILIITANRRDLLNTCLMSIKDKLDVPLYEVILVDNNSEDDTVNFVSRNWPQVKLISNAVNRGVAPARNQALSIASGEFVLILDDDAQLIEGSFQSMIDLMTVDEEIGLIGCKVVGPNGDELDSKRTFPLITHSLLRRLEAIGPLKKSIQGSTTIKQHKLQGRDLSKPLEVNLVEGVFQLISRRAFIKVGLLDSTMFYSAEDIDYCVRVQQAGFKCYYFPGFTVVHHKSELSKKGFFNKYLVYQISSFYTLYRKHYRWMKRQNVLLIEQLDRKEKGLEQ